MDVNSVPVVKWNDAQQYAQQYIFPNSVGRAPLNQGDCGACWAIASASCFAERAGLPLSRATLDDITHNSGDCVTYRLATGCNSRCEGGFMLAGLLFIRNTGLLVPSGAAQVKSVSNNADNKERRKCGLVYRVNEFDTFGVTNRAFIEDTGLSSCQLRRSSDNIMREIANNGCVCATFNMFSNFTEFWQKESSDAIYRLSYQAAQKGPSPGSGGDCQGSKSWTEKGSRGPQNQFFVTAHSVVIIGFGSAPPSADMNDKSMHPYWICRNSWGAPSNRPGGLFRIARGENMCGIESDVLACLPNPESGLSLPLAMYSRGATLTSVRPTSHFQRNILIVGLLVLIVLFMSRQRTDKSS